MKVISRRIVIGIVISAALAGGFLSRFVRRPFRSNGATRGPMRPDRRGRGRSPCPPAVRALHPGRGPAAPHQPARGRFRRRGSSCGDAGSASARRTGPGTATPLERAKAARRASEARVRQAKQSYRAGIARPGGARRFWPNRACVLPVSASRLCFWRRPERAISRRRNFRSTRPGLTLRRHAQFLSPTRPAGSPPRLEFALPVTGRVLRVTQESERSLPAGSPVLEVGDPRRGSSSSSSISCRPMPYA